MTDKQAEFTANLNSFSKREGFLQSFINFFIQYAKQLYDKQQWPLKALTYGKF